MQLSVIVPVYNVEKYLAFCLNSLLNQGLPVEAYEIIIIDDGAEDKSLSIAQKYQAEHPNIHVHSQENKGVGAARNKGIDLAKGKYIYFIDPDDFLRHHTLNKLLEIAATSALEILGFKSSLAKNHNKREAIIPLPDPSIEVSDGISYIGENSFKNEVWWYLVKRDFLTKNNIRFIEGKWMEDAIFTASLFLKAQRVAFVNIDCHLHVKVPGSAMTKREAAHYTKVLFDKVHAAHVYNDLILQLSELENISKACKRLRTKQESFVFFLTARAFRSNLNFGELWQILLEMKEIGAYPLRHFISNEYNGIVYRLCTVVFNNKTLLQWSYNGFRFLRSFKSK